MLNNIQTIETSQLVVMREGKLDEAWLTSYEKAVRAAQLHELGTQTLSLLGRATVASAKAVGRGTMAVVSGLVESV